MGGKRFVGRSSGVGTSMSQRKRRGEDRLALMFTWKNQLF